MKLRILGAFGGELGPYRNSAFLLGNGVMVDAGGASAAMSLEDLRALRAVVLTHAHADHVSSLPFLLDARIGMETLDVYALRETIAALRIHLFNNKIWPDFERIPDPRHPILRFHEVERERPLDLHGLRFLPVGVDHTIPTVGYIVSDGKASIVFSGDTGPTKRIWELTAKATGLRAILLELSFPARLDRVATISKHLSTLTIEAELAKLPAGVPVHLTHLKPSCLEELKAEMAPILARAPHVRYLEQDRTYEL